MSREQPLVLVIEDDPSLRQYLHTTLRSHGYQVEMGSTWEEGRNLAALLAPDVMLLDLGLPDGDGISLARELKATRQIPIIVVSARAREEDKILALDMGVDDYVTKPFGSGELLARIRVALRHQARDAGTPETPVFELGDWRIDLARREVTVAGREVHLTPIEYRLLTTLVKHAGMVLTHHLLLKEVWGGAQGAQPHYLRVYMAQLRQKMEADPARPKHLITEPGVGYRLRTE
jgi:two-component system KDP operon response regulator KdpE